MQFFGLAACFSQYVMSVPLTADLAPKLPALHVYQVS